MTTLKPCPFCNGPVVIRKNNILKHMFYSIECDRCEVRMESAKSVSETNFVFLERAEESMIDKWNKELMRQ